MIKDIRYGGYSTSPSEYDCVDGELAAIRSLIKEDGSVRPILAPKELFRLPAGYVVAYIHGNSGYRHYILRNGKQLYWFDDSVSDDGLTNAVDITAAMLKPLHNYAGEIYEVNSIGNTLVVLTADGMHYSLWKGGETGYHYLGSHIPELPISFGLQGEMVRGEEFQISDLDPISFMNGDLWKELSDENKTKVTNQVLGKVNTFIAENSTNAGKFIFPFLVRYAYRLYDQSIVMHSSPVLMVCSSDLAPQCFGTELKISGIFQIRDLKVRLCSMFHQLDYAVENSEDITALQDWKDIVKSVDIFISKPIYTYDQNGKCERFLKTDYSDGYCVCKHTNQAADETKFPVQYQKADFAWLYAKTFEPETLTMPEWRVELPRRDAEAVKADIGDSHVFYLLQSINIDELKTERTIVPISKEYLQSLVNREAMSDDYCSHDTLIPQYSFVFNRRLNAANVKKMLFGGFKSGSMLSYTDGYVMNFSNLPPTSLNYKSTVHVYFFIREEGKEIVVRGVGSGFGQYTPILFLFYPNPNAYKALVSVDNDKLYEVGLEPHPTLYGAYYFENWEGAATKKHEVKTLPTISGMAERTIEMPNKIYTSEVNNPFYFPSRGVNMVGNGKIMGICSVTKALSQGQWGQFPLYAFTDEGVWAMEVSQEGFYKEPKSITRDVCINARSITQIDSAVVFATDRGIMMLSGSESRCISDEIYQVPEFDVDELPGLRLMGVGVVGFVGNVGVVGFGRFCRECRMIYDYVHQRIIVYNGGYGYAYVYSLKSKKWGMVTSEITESLNSYPKAYALLQKENGGLTIADYSEDGEGLRAVKGLIVTRALKLETTDELKTVSCVIQRGNFKKGHVKSILYGSRDLQNWFAVASSEDHYLRGFRGTPYKYFRLALICDLERGESVSGCTVELSTRLTNRLR